MNYKILKDLREDNDFLQKTIADKLGISRQQYSLYETGKRELPIHLLIELSKIYNKSTDYILGLNNDSLTIESNNNFTKKQKTVINQILQLDEKSLTLAYIYCKGLCDAQNLK